MKEQFINWGTNFISKYENCDDLKIIKLKYGLEGIYNLIIKMTIVIIISLITHTCKATLMFLIFYAGIRTYSFGWHAKSNIGCWITTILIYNIIPFILQSINISQIYGLVICLIALISMIIWSPADTPKRPLIHADKRKKAKIMCVSTTIIYIIIYLFSSNNLVNNALIYALIIQSLFINPLFYKLTNTRFNNYKYYKKNN